MTPSPPPRPVWRDRLKGFGLFVLAVCVSGLLGAMTVDFSFLAPLLMLFVMGMAWSWVKQHFSAAVLQGFHLGALLAALLVATCFGLVFWNLQMH